MGAFFAVALALTGGVIAYTMFGADDRARGSAVEGVDEWEGLSNAHVPMDARVDCEMYPPAGGEHYDAWQNCGVYEGPLRTGFAVHSQEHGAVWITHDPHLDRDEVQRLHDLYTPGEYIIVSPMEDLPAPVVVSGWEAQVRLDGADDPRIGPFLRQYVRSPDVPEPGAPCSGMFDGTEADFDAERTPADLGVERDGEEGEDGGAMPQGRGSAPGTAEHVHRRAPDRAQPGSAKRPSSNGSTSPSETRPSSARSRWIPSSQTASSASLGTGCWASRNTASRRPRTWRSVPA